MKSCGQYCILMTIGLLSVLLSCSNDIDINANYQPVPLVFCQFDPTDSFCYVTLSKTFQATSDAHKILSGQKNTLVDDAEISLEAWGSGYKAWETQFSRIEPALPFTGYYIFSRSLYRSNKSMNFQDPSSQGLSETGIIDYFRLIITSPELSQISYSRVPIINAPILLHPITPIPFNLYGDKYSYFHYRIWDDNIQHADFLCDFHFLEFTDKWDDRTVQMILKKNIEVRDSIYIRIYEDSFFNKLVQKIGNNPDVAARLFKSIDFTLLVSDIYFHNYYTTYNGLNENDNGFSSNIINGIGLFSVKRKVIVTNIIFDRITFDSLCYGRFTKQLRFREW